MYTEPTFSASVEIVIREIAQLDFHGSDGT